MGGTTVEVLAQCFSLFHKGGPVMYILALCSVAVLAIWVERYLYYKEMTKETENFIPTLQGILEKNNIGEAMQLCQRTKSGLAIIALKGLQAVGQERNIESVLEGSALLMAARLREYLNYLSTMVTLAPLLGLLGTVIGMINSFSVLNVKTGQPLAITSGVGEALVATATGLSVAILAMVVHTYYSHRLDGIITDIEEMCNMLVGSLGNKKVARGKTHEIA